MSELSAEAKALLSRNRTAGEPSADDVARVRRKVLAAAEQPLVVQGFPAGLARPPVAPPRPEPWTRREVALLAAAVLLVVGGAYLLAERPIVVSAPAAAPAPAASRTTGVDNWNRHQLTEARVAMKREDWTLARRELVEIAARSPGFEADEVTRLLSEVDSMLAKASALPLSPSQQALSECQTALERGEADRWSETERSCKHAVELDPYDQSARDALAAASREVGCHEALTLGLAAFTADQVERGLELLSLITGACPMTLHVSIQAREATLAEAKRRAAARCEASAKAGRWAEALPSCERYARLECFDPTPEVAAPSSCGATGASDPKAVAAAKDPVLTWFFTAREKVTPKAEPWTCAPPAQPRALVAAATASTEPREVLAARYADPAELQAVLSYVEGRFSEATVPLEKKAAPAGSTLLLDLTNAIASYQAGLSEIARDKPERAQEFFTRALKLDERILLGSVANLPLPQRWKARAVRSFLRRGAEESMAKSTYEKGKSLADRKDFKQACFLWKMGIAFTRANHELLKACFFCTQKATKLLESAKGCDDLAQVLEYAVDGDGVREDVERRRVELRCEPEAPSVDPTDFLTGRADELAELPKVRRLVESDPKNADAWLRLGWLCKSAGLKREAIDAFTTYLRLRPDALNEKEIEDELSFLGKELPGAESEADGVRRRFLSGDVDGALRGALACAKQDPKCQTLVGQLTDLRARLPHVARLTEKEQASLVELDLLIGGGTPSPASMAVREKLSAAWFLQASRARAAGDWRRAVGLVRKVLVASPGHAGASTLLQDARSAAKDVYLRAYQLKDTAPEEAARLFRDVVEMTPKDDEYHQKAALRLSESMSR